MPYHLATSQYVAGAERLEHPPAVLETATLPVELYPRMVMPAGLEPAISSLRGWRPYQLDEGTVWRCGPDLNRRTSSFAGCPLEPLEYRIMSGIAGFEPAMPASKVGALTTWPYPSIVETHAGLEPVIATVKGLCPHRLDEWAVLQGGKLPAHISGNRMNRHQNIINSHMQQSCQHDQIIDRW